MSENTFSIRLCGIDITFAYPEELDDEIWPHFGHLAREEESTDAPKATLVLQAGEGGRLHLHRDGRLVWRDLAWPDALHPLLDEIGRIVAVASTRPVLRASAVELDGKAILIVGPPGCGKTSLAAWFVNSGFRYLADDLVCIGDALGNIRVSALPLAPHAAVSPQILTWPSFIDAYASLTDPGAVIKADAVAGGHDGEWECGLVICPQHHAGSTPQIQVVPPDDRRFLLGLALHPDQGASGASEARLSAFSQQVPAVRLRFGQFGQLEGLLDDFTRRTLAGGLQAASLAYQSELKIGQQRASDTTIRAAGEWLLPKPAIATPRKRLSIGMATFDDYDGVYFTLQALRLYHPEVAGDIEFMVVDNNPDGVCGEPLRRLARSSGGFRYIPVTDSIGTAVRDFVMREASSDYVACLDCHVLLAPGSLARLLRYFEEHPDSNDLLQGPLVNDDLVTLSTHWRAEWSGGMYGSWALDEAARDPEAPPFDIPMQGLGLYACRRAAWPGYNRLFRGFGGEEGYIHEKFRQAGGRTLCLPFLRWLHRFERPMGAPYTISWHDRIRNYMIGFDELGLPMEEMLTHFRDYIGPAADPIIRDCWQELERLRIAQTG